MLGDNLMLRQSYPDAIHEYRQALKIDPRLTGVHLSIGQATPLPMAGNRRTMRRLKMSFEKELAIDPNNADAFFQLGQIAYSRGEVGMAEHFS